MKPDFLYHASSNRNIDEFEPRAEKVRHTNEGPVVFAGEDEAGVSKFIVPADDTWSQLSRFGGVHAAIYSNRERFKSADKGGSIYRLSSDSFSIDRRFSGSSREWTSKKPVKPLKKTEYASGLDTMLSFGVQVYFVDERKLWEIKEAPDHGLSIIRGLKSENEIRGVNVKEFPS